MRLEKSKNKTNKRSKGCSQNVSENRMNFRKRMQTKITYIQVKLTLNWVDNKKESNNESLGYYENVLQDSVHVITRIMLCPDYLNS